jgi:hypothetical protein
MMHSLLLSSLLSFSFCSGGACLPSELPQRTLVGVSVIDTPIVRDAISYTGGYEDNSVFNHSMRSWLFGAIIVNKNPKYTKSVDREIHALGSILHDVGFDPKVVIDTANIDPDHPAKGAKAVRNFLANNAEGKLWDPARTQVLVDSVTMHLQDTDSTKAIEIHAVRDGQQVDLTGNKSPGFVTPADYDAIVAAYPLGSLKDHIGEEMKMQPQGTGGHMMGSDSMPAHGGHDMHGQM